VGGELGFLFSGCGDAQATFELVRRKWQTVTGIRGIRAGLGISGYYKCIFYH